MHIIKRHEVKANPSRLAEAAAAEPSVPASAERQPRGPTAMHVPAQAGRRMGFLAGQSAVPRDFDRMGAAEIVRRFEGEE